MNRIVTIALLAIAAVGCQAASDIPDGASCWNGMHELHYYKVESRGYVRYGAHVFPVVKSHRNGYSDLPPHTYYTYESISELTTPDGYSGCVVMDTNPGGYPYAHLPGAEPAPTPTPYGK